MATLSTYTVHVQNEVDDTSSRAQSVIERGLQDVYQEILKHCSRYLIGTTTYSAVATAGSQQYTPTAFYETVRVMWHNADQTNFNELKEISETEAIEQHYNAADGSPQFYYRNANTVILVPTPNNAGTLEVVYVPVQNELTGATVSVVPDRYTNVVLLGGVARFKMYEGVSEAVDYQAKYAASLQDMKKELAAQFTPVKPKFFGR